MPARIASLLALAVCGSSAALVADRTGNPRPISPDAPLAAWMPSRWILAVYNFTEVNRTAAAGNHTSFRELESTAARAPRRHRCAFVTWIMLAALLCAGCCCCYLRAADAGTSCIVCATITLVGFIVATEANYATGLYHGFARDARDGRPLPLAKPWCWLPLSLTAFWSAWYFMLLILVGGVMLMALVALGAYSFSVLLASSKQKLADGSVASYAAGQGAAEEDAAEAELAVDRAFAAMECSVCLCGYTLDLRRPHVLSCGHTFCRKCIAQLTISGRLLCPTCRMEISSADVRVNYALHEMLARPSR